VWELGYLGKSQIGGPSGQGEASPVRRRRSKGVIKKKENTGYKSRESGRFHRVKTVEEGNCRKRAGRARKGEHKYILKGGQRCRNRDGWGITILNWKGDKKPKRASNVSALRV